MKHIQKRISLGYPLDLLLNRECKFEYYEKEINEEFLNINMTSEMPGSIILPNSENPGTGNIIIRGKPGTAKSTLALQFAVASAQKTNNCISFYVTLEERPENILYKSKLFGWDSFCSVFNQVCGLNEAASSADYKHYMVDALVQNTKYRLVTSGDKENNDKLSNIDSHVYITTFSPRNLFVSDLNDNTLYWDRFSQLERLLSAADSYNKTKNDNDPRISFICLDSINVFGDTLLNRTELFRLFDLFKRYEIIGIIIVEEDERYIYNNNGKLHGETIEYIGDMIISMTTEEDQNYSLRYLEVSKSRYQHQIYGKHPFKIHESLLTIKQQEDFLKKLSSLVLDPLEYGKTWKITANVENKGTNLELDRRELENYREYINSLDALKIDYDTIRKDLFKIIEKLHNIGDSFCVCINDSNFVLHPEHHILSKIENYKFKCSLEEGELKFESFPLENKNDEDEIYLIFKKKDTRWHVTKKTKKKTDIINSLALIKYIKTKPVYAVKIYPSLHYIVFGTDFPKKSKKTSNNLEELFFEKNISKYMSSSFTIPGVILIEGPYATFKTTLAKDFLLRGLYKEINKKETNDRGEQISGTNSDPQDAHVILIRLADESSIYDGVTFRLSNSFIKDFNINENGQSNSLVNSFVLTEINETPKRIIKEYRVNHTLKVSGNLEQKLEGTYTQIVFKSGHILPEEFVQVLLEIFNKPVNNGGTKKIKTRIVFDEIGRIGTSYPLLLKSKSSGELFLTAIIHILKNYEASVILTGTTEEFEKADMVINQVKTLADTVLSTRNVNVFGDNYIILKGEGLITQRSSNGFGEKVPAAVLPISKSQTQPSSFEVDKNYFNGLVGFDTNYIQRPGICIYIFAENKLIHQKYNKNLENMLEAAFTTSKPLTIKDEKVVKDIGVVQFNGAQSPSYHNSLDIAQGNPLDKTILFTIDEFFKARDLKEFTRAFLGIDKQTVEDELKFGKEFIESCTFGEDKNYIHSFPLYDNVLFIAINKEHFKKSTDSFDFSTIKDWDQLYNIVTKNNIARNIIDLCLMTRETLSCILLDTLLHCQKKKINNQETIEIKTILENIDEKALVKELRALGKLFNLSERVKDEFLKDKEATKKVGDVAKDIKKNQLLPNSAIYVCWYSQIRELIYRCPQLSSKFEVIALPGKGFKGDWHIGILKGSVSASLGLKVIKKLCSKNEDFKRFTLGIGLPTNARFREKNDFPAWPNSNINIDKAQRSDLGSAKVKTQLDLIYHIYNQAYERGKIINYLQYKDLLVDMFQELIMIEGMLSKTLDESQIIKKVETNIIKRLKNDHNILFKELYQEIEVPEK